MSNYSNPPPDDAGTFELPADKQAELATLGAFLFDPHLMMERARLLRPEHFYYELHQRVFRRMREFWDNGEPLDVTLLADRDSEMTIALIDAQDACFSVGYGVAYANRVIDLAQKRHFLVVAQHTSEMSLNGKTPTEISAYLQQEISALQMTGGGNPFDRWLGQTMTAAQMAEAEDTERTYIVHDFLRDGSLSVVFGKPGEFKSMLLMDMMICVGGGLPWLQPLATDGNTQAAIHTRQARGLWLNYDQAHEDVIERFGALHRAYGVGGENVVAISQSEPAAVLLTDEQARKLGEWVADEAFELVVVDSLIDIRGTRKLIEEEMGDLLRLWRIVAEVSGAAVVIISHPTKNTADLYGSQFIKAKLDHLYVVTRSGDRVEIESQKQRSFGMSEKLRARWTYEHKPNSRTLALGRFWGDDSAMPHSENVTTQEECLAALMTMPGRALTADRVTEIINRRREERGQEPLAREAVRIALRRLETNHRNVGKLDDPLRYHFGAVAE